MEAAIGGIHPEDGEGITVDVTSRENLSVCRNGEAVVVVGVISEDRLGIGTEFDAHSVDKLIRLDGDEITIAIAIEITDRAQGSLGGSGKAIQHVARITGKFVELKISDRL